MAQQEIDVETGLDDMFQQRLRERAVAVCTIARRGAVLGRKGNDRALIRLDRRQPAPEGRAARPELRLDFLQKGLLRQASRKTIAQSGSTAHRIEYQIERQRLKSDLALVVEPGIDRDQIVRSGHLDAMTGIEHRGDFRLVGKLGKFHQRIAQGIVVEIEFDHDLEADARQNGCHVLGIIVRIGERRLVFIPGIADDERNLAVRCRLSRGAAKNKHRHDGGKQRQDTSLENPNGKHDHPRCRTIPSPAHIPD